MVHQDDVWGKIFGFQIDSHTVEGVRYTVALTSKGWTCDCMDFKIRQGSWEVRFDDQHFHTCKHVIDHLRDLYYKDMEAKKHHEFQYRKMSGRGFANWKYPEAK